MHFFCLHSSDIGFRPPGSQTAYCIPIPCIFFPSLSLCIYIYRYTHTHIYTHTFYIYGMYRVYIYIYILVNQSHMFGPFSYHRTAIVSWLCFGPPFLVVAPWPRHLHALLQHLQLWAQRGAAPTSGG